MEILVNYEAVYRQVAELRQEIAFEMQGIEAEYHHIQQMFGELDGKANAALMDAFAESKLKKETTANIPCSLLSFIENAARTMEAHEHMIKQMFLTPQPISGNEGES
ncbi:MAG: hypothetical protein FWE05_02650 [Defluviitaleaceae bacterium]|nr:hypothetical protein [Defluviitaleaceae bacterium]